MQDPSTLVNRHPVLVAEPDPGSRRRCRDLLVRAGFSVVEAADADAARTALGLQSPSAVVLAPTLLPSGQGPTAEHFVASSEATGALLAPDGAEASARPETTAIVATTERDPPATDDALVQAVRFEAGVHHLRSRLREREGDLEEVQRLGSIGRWRWASDAKLVSCSPEAIRILGIQDDRRPLSWPRLLALIDPRDRRRVIARMSSAIRDGEGYRLEHRIVSEQGEERVILHVADACLDSNGESVGLSGVIQDVTEQRQSDTKIRYLAYFDSVTGLPNRTLLKQIFHQARANALRYRRSFALLFIDLDHFKRINDAFGHEIGDLVLREVSARLRKCLRRGNPFASNDGDADLADTGALGGDAIARLGGDEFVVLVGEVKHSDHAAIVARRMIETLSAPIDVGRALVQVSTSIGIAISPLDGNQFEAVLNNADVAMYHAKNSGRNRVQYYSKGLNEQAQARFALEQDLKGALERQEFEVFYQPVVNLDSQRVSGVEALLRWNHPRKGVLGPDVFLSIAEEIGLMANIDAWVLDTVFSQCAAWHRQGLVELRVSINASPAQFRSGHLHERLAECVRTTGLASGTLDIEVSEGLLFDDADAVRPTLEQLGALGIGVTIDNFGRGRSSLAVLRDLDIGTIKIDKVFLDRAMAGGADLVINEAILALARGLGHRVIAEGVETREQLRVLVRSGCDEAQGYYFAPPLPVDLIEPWITRRYHASQPCQHPPMDTAAFGAG